MAQPFFVKLPVQILLMKYWKNALRTGLALFLLSFIFLQRKQKINTDWLPLAMQQIEPESAETGEGEEAKFSRDRLLHEFKMLRNPVTGTIPPNVHDMEMRVAKKIPGRNSIFDLSFSEIYTLR